MAKHGSAWGSEKTQFFYGLEVGKVLDAVESFGFRCTGRAMPLNSFENRVYEVEVEPDDRLLRPNCRTDRLVVKFYRPGRWTKEQINEEHSFLHELAVNEVPVVDTLKAPDGGSIFEAEGLFCAIWPKIGGRVPDDLDDSQLRWLGRLLARIHATGRARSAPSRIDLNPTTYGLANLDYLVNGHLPPNLAPRFVSAVKEICATTAPWFERAPHQRIHGDCHRNNLLWHDEGPVFLDFDDMVTGPPVQDLWLFLPHEGAELREKIDVLLEGYETMQEFDRRSLRLIEPLRALRYIHYCGWIARRWEDPAFPANFPFFGQGRYWEEIVGDIESQLGKIRILDRNPDWLFADVIESPEAW